MSTAQKADKELDDYFFNAHHRFTQTEPTPALSKHFKNVVFDKHPNS